MLLIALVAALLVAGPLVARSQRRSAWDTEARALESETRTIVTTRLPPVLSRTTTGRRSLVWPPVRADLTAILIVQPRTEPPPAGEPGPPAFQT